MKAFVTGSQVYGTPRPDSDVDLVVLMDVRELDILKLRLSGQWEALVEYQMDASFKIGKLNLICLTNEGEFEQWQIGTDELKARKPVTREEAKKHLDARVDAHFANTATP